ncbi:cysteine peptidase family C39 domain-containing protein [Treponema sp. UBA3813]|nr:cysteine peptidase family C39 domain-containing protein [Treponema sp. UBA3813]
MRTILQHDETDCAAACLAMILSHFGKEVPIPSVLHTVNLKNQMNNEK